MNKKLFPALCIAAAVLGVSACGAGSATSEGQNGSSSASSSPSAASSRPSGKSQGQAGAEQGMPKPDLKGIPAVVATVNGQKISKGEFVQVYTSQFQQLAMQSQMSGQKLDQNGLKKQVAQSLVGSTLLTQAADKRRYSPSQADVNRTLTDLARQNGMKSGQQLMDALTKQGRKKGPLVAQVKEQAKVDHLIVEKSGNLDPSTKELKQAYRQMSQQANGSKVPSFHKVRPQLKQQLTTQKKQQAAQTVVQQLRKTAHVTINL